MSDDRKTRGHKLAAAVSAVLAEDRDSLWPEQIRALETALGVARSLNHEYGR